MKNQNNSVATKVPPPPTQGSVQHNAQFPPPTAVLSPEQNRSGQVPPPPTQHVPTPPPPPSTTAPCVQDKQAKVAPEKMLIDEVAGFQLFMDKTTPYIELPGEHGCSEIVLVGEKDFNNWLTDRVFKKSEIAPSGDVLKKVFRILSSRASKEGKHVTLHNRFASHDGRHYIDLRDDTRSAIEISPQGWHVVVPPDVYFRRHQTALPIDVPSSEGNALNILRYVNIPEEEQQLLFVVYAITHCITDIERPLLCLYGDTASGKTTAAKMLHELWDPSSDPITDAPPNDRELALMLHNRAVLIFDNRTNMSGSRSDLFCQAVTGGGFTTRKLYTDTDSVDITFRSAPIFTALEPFNDRLDFQNRCLAIHLPSIKPKNRHSKEELMQAFQAELSSIRGGMLDVLVRALQIKSRLSLVEKSRLCEWDKLGCAVSIALGKDPRIFLRARIDHEQNSGANMQADIISALADVVNTHSGAVQTASKWTELLNARLDDLGTGKSVNDAQFGKLFQHSENALKSVGITFDKRRSRRGVEYTLTMEEIQASSCDDVIRIRHYCDYCKYHFHNIADGIHSCKSRQCTLIRPSVENACQCFEVLNGDWDIKPYVAESWYGEVASVSSIIGEYYRIDDVVEDSNEDSGIAEEDDYDGYKSIF